MSNWGKDLKELKLTMYRVLCTHTKKKVLRKDTFVGISWAASPFSILADRRTGRQAKPNSAFYLSLQHA